MHRGTRILATTCAAALCVCALNCASAQEVLPEATGSSERAAFQPEGLPLGGFRVYPQMRVTETYNDNIVYGSPQRLADLIFVVAPTVDIRSQWSRNELDAQAFVTASRYAKYGIENNETYGVRGNEKVDLSHGLTLQAAAGYGHLVVQQGTPEDALNTSTFAQFDEADYSADLRKQFNRIGVTVGGTAATYRYDPVDVAGVSVDQHYRDRNTASLNGRLDYQYSAITTLFATGSINQMRYTNAASLIDRSSNGFTALVGAQFNISQLLIGQASVGYISQRFRNPAFPDFHGIDYSLDLTYAVTALTSFHLTGSRTLTGSAISQVAGVLASQVKLSVEHELLRNFLLSASFGYNGYEYRGINLNLNRFDYGLGMRYKINRLFSCALSYDRVSQSSSGAYSLPYDSNRVSISVIVTR